MNYSDTIAAVSTPRGKGGVALIRISGSDALKIGDAVFSKKLSETPSNLSVYGKIYMTLEDGSRKQIDDGLATVFRAPASFTGEDTVEICCHGGALVTETVLTACITAGARQALAGEFTRRSYINGKTKLDAAEALGNLLDAVTYDQMLLARSGMTGRLAKKTEELYDVLLSVAAELRADIDFPDEDVSDMTDKELREKLQSVYDELAKLSSTYKTGKAITQGVETVICGRTNSGKSSLYNLILGHDAAIVTDIEGTTRDILSDTASFGGVTLHISDTAGLRSSRDVVENIGIERALDAVDRAGLIFAVIDGSREPTDDDREYISMIKRTSAYKIAVINKSDISTLPNAYELADGFDSTVTVSAKDGNNIEELEKAVRDAFIDGNIDIGKDTVVSTARQYGVLIKACDRLRSALASLDDGIPVDLVCSDIECALDELAEMGGKAASEDIVDSIFSKFCVGK